MPEISEQDFAALAAQVASLSSALAVARRRIDDLEDGMTGHLGLDWGESLVDVNSPHPNISANTIESGGGIIRQDRNAMQIVWDSTAESTGVVFTDRFTDDPLTHAPTGGLRGRVDTDAGIAVSQIFAAYTDTELASYVTAANGPVANVIDLHARDSSTSEFGRFIIYANLPYANLTGVAYKSSLSADPDSGSLVEGMFWYNTTDDAFKGYRGSSKLEFLMEGDAGSTLTNQTGTYSAAVGDFVRAVGTFTVTLPSAPANDSEVVVKNAGTGVITVARGGSDTIFEYVSGGTSVTIAPGEARSFKYYSSGTEWEVF